MKKLTTLALLILLATPQLVFSQKDVTDEELDKELAELGFENVEYKEEKGPYFGIGGGYTGTLLFPNYDDINSLFAAPGPEGFGFEELDSYVYLNGGEGVIVSFLIPNLRLAFYGMGGGKTLEQTVTVNQEELTRTMDYSIGLTALSFEYAIVPIKGFAIVPAAGIGYGSLMIDVYQGSDFNWGDISPGPSQSHWMQRVESSYFFVNPKLNIEIAVTEFFMIRLSAGYPLSFSPSWEYNRGAGDSELKDAPDIKSDGLAFQFGLFLGLFNY